MGGSKPGETVKVQQTHILNIVVELVGNNSKFLKLQSSWEFLGLVIPVSAMPDKVVQPEGRGRSHVTLCRDQPVRGPTIHQQTV